MHLLYREALRSYSTVQYSEGSIAGGRETLLLFWHCQLDQILFTTVIWLDKLKECHCQLLQLISGCNSRSVRQPAPIHSCCTICSMVLLLIERNFPLRNDLKNSTRASQSGWPLRSAIERTTSISKHSSTFQSNWLMWRPNGSHSLDSHESLSLPQFPPLRTTDVRVSHSFLLVHSEQADCCWKGGY